MKTQKIFLTLYIMVFILSLLSIVNCYDFLTWLLEVIPVYAGIIIIYILNKKNIKISNLLQSIILLHMIILIIGGHYSYAKVPFFDYLKDIFNWNRNNYDKVGHFIQGITPFLITKEILIKNNTIKNNLLLNFLSISVSLAFSALYELIEFSSAIVLGNKATDFLGTQGDIWDTQKDMLFALIGAITICLTTMTYKYQIKPFTK